MGGGGNFARKCISTTPIGVPIYIYLASGGNTPCSATGFDVMKYHHRLLLLLLLLQNIPIYYSFTFSFPLR